MGYLTKTLKRKEVSKKLPVILMATALLCSCASTKHNTIHEAGIEISDPFEEQNRRVMAFNKVVDNTIIHPVVEGYRYVAPQPVRSGVRNVLRNLRSPITLGNQLLQGDLPGARDALLRAAVNTTVGVGGLFDVAGYEGIEYEPEDFGQTLAVWGVDPGPYMVVPLIGPSSIRDYTGYFVDGAADPLRWYLFNIDEMGVYTAKFGLDYLDLRDSLMDTLVELDKSSIDYYAAVRSAYYQHRQALINDMDGTAQTSIPAIPAIPAIPYYEDDE